MKKTTWKKIVSFVLVAALVISVAHFGGTKVKAEEAPRATAEATVDYLDDDLTPSIQYGIEHHPADEQGPAPEVDVVVALDVSGSMDRGTVNNQTYMAIAAAAAKAFISNLGENVNVTVIGFGPELVIPESTDPIKAIDEIAAKAAYNNGNNQDGNRGQGVTYHGTNTPAAVDEAIEELSDSTNRKFLVVVTDGDPYVNGSNATGESMTKDSLNNAKENNITRYAINLAYVTDRFVDYFEGIYEADDLTGLNNAFSSIEGEIKKIFADAKIVATIGNYVEPVIEAENVVITGKELVWTAPKFAGTADEAGKYVQTSPILDFKVKVGDLEASEEMTDEELEDLVKALMDAQKADEKAGNPQEIFISEIDGGLRIDVKVTSTAKLIFTIDGNDYDQTIETQRTATIFAPVPTCTVTFKVDDVQLGEVQTVKYGESAEEPDVPKKDEEKTETESAYVTTTYVFSGWDTEDYKEVKKDLVVKGTYVGTPNSVTKTFTVKFEVEGKQVGEIQTVNYGESAVEPDVPKKEAEKTETESAYVTTTYEFGGWDTDFSKVTKDLVVKGSYNGTPSSVAKTFTVKFEVEGKQVGETQTVKYGEAAVAPAVSKDTVTETTEKGTVRTSYSFGGWDTDFSKVTKDLVVKGSFTPIVVTDVNTFTVTFKVDGVQVGEVQLVKYGEAAKAPEVAKKEDTVSETDAATITTTYEFSGWDTDFSKVTKDLVVEGKYVGTPNSVDKTFTVIFKVDGVQVGDAQTVKYGDAAVAPAVSKDDTVVQNGYITTTTKYTFSGWSKDFSKVTENLVVEGSFTPNVTTVDNTPKTPETPIIVPETPVVPVIVPSTPTVITYTLTVNYVYEDGSKAADSVVKALEPGEAYKVESPAIAGYTPDQAVVEGSMVVFNKTITVTYTKDAEPEPEVEEEIEIEPVIETPEGAPEEEEEIEEEEEEIEIEPIVETPEGTPEEEELDIDDIETPEGLPQTGTTPIAVFFGIGAACIIFGGAMIIKVRRREEEM